jgi:DNA-directed DNA polymerase III PolC
MFIHLHNHSNFSFLDSTLAVDNIVDLSVDSGAQGVALTDTNGLYAAVTFYKYAREKGIKPIIGAEVDDARSRPRAVLLARNLHGYQEISALITRRQLDPDFSLTPQLQEISDDVFILTDDIELLRLLRGTPSVFAEMILTPQSLSHCRRLYEFAREHDIPCVATNDVHFAAPADFETYRIARAIALRANVHAIPAAHLVSREQYLKAPQEMARTFRGLREPLRRTLEIADACELEIELGRWRFPRCEIPHGETPFSHLCAVCFEGLKQRYRPLTRLDGQARAALRRLQYELDVIDERGFSEYFLVVWRIAEEAHRRGFLTLARGSAVNSIVSYALGLSHVDPIRYKLYFERFLNPERASPPDIDLDFSWKDRDEILQWLYDYFGAERVALISTVSTMQPRQAIREVAKALGVDEQAVNKFTRYIPGYFTAGGIELRDLAKIFPECKALPLEDEPWRTTLAHAQRLLGFPRTLSIHCGGVVIAPDRITNYTPLQRAAKGFVITQMEMHAIEDLGLIKIDLLSQRSLGALKDCLNAVKEHHGSVPDVFNFEMVTHDCETVRLVREGRTMGCFYIESPGMRALLERLTCDNFELLIAASSIIRPGVAESGMMRAFIERHRDPSRAEYLHPRLRDLLAETYGVMIYQEDVLKVAHELGGMSLGEADLLRRAMSGKLRSRDRMESLTEKFFTSCRRQNIPDSITREIWRQIVSFAGYSFCKGHSAAFAMLSYQVAYLKAHYPAEFFAAVLSNGGGFYEAGAYIQEARRMGLRIMLPCVNESEREYVGRDGALRIGFMAVKGLTERSVGAILAACSEDKFRDLGDFLRRVRLAYREARTLVLVGAFDCFGEKRTRLMLHLDTLFCSPCASLSCGSRRLQSACSLDGTRAVIPFASAQPEIAEGRPRHRQGCGYHLIPNPSSLGFLPVPAERAQLQSGGRATALQNQIANQFAPDGHSDPFACHSERSEESRLSDAQGKLREESRLSDAQGKLREESRCENQQGELRDFDLAERCRYEMEILGYTVSAHPLEFIHVENVVAARDVERYIGKRVRMVGWQIASKLIRTKSSSADSHARRNGHYMKFMSLEDLTGTFEATLFPRVYARYAPLTLSHGPFLLDGILDASTGTISLNVSTLQSLCTKK